MRMFSREATGYAVLLVFLFVLAALAVSHVLDFVQARVSPDDSLIVAVLIGAITFGFMLIAGAFGLWAIQFAAAAEGGRRVGRLLTAMDYIQDGVIAIDPKGRITGSNPAMLRLCGTDIPLDAPGTTVSQLFPCLKSTDLELILESREPYEVEHKLFAGELVRTLRFRTQPLEGFTVMLVSDVSSMEARRIHNRLVARLQLIGQIARGVAYDFNNILCAISGHASLLSRLPPNSPDALRSIKAINVGAERGTVLAAHLLELSTPSADGSVPRMSTEYLLAAVSALRDSLPEGWRVEAEIDEVPPMSLTGIKIEQIILNLGMLVADRASQPGTLRVIAKPPDGNHPLLNVGAPYAGVLLLSCTASDAAVTDAPMRDASGSAGVIVSVIRSMIEEANGSLEGFRAADGSLIYRVALPREGIADGPYSLRDAYASDLGPYIADWQLLLVAGTDRAQAVQERLNTLNVHVARVDNFVAALGRMETTPPLDAIVIDERQTTTEARGLLRAVLKLCPTAAVVLLTEGATEIATQFATDIVFVPYAEAGDRVLMALIEARSLAVKRHPA